MNNRLRLLRASRALIVLLVLLVGVVTTAFAQNNRRFFAGQIVLYCKPGTPRAEVDRLAAAVQATNVEALLLADCYKLTLPAVLRTDKDTLDAVAKLKTEASVRWVGANRKYWKTQTSGPPTLTPNDTLYPQQWALPMIRVPQGWVLQQGATGVNVAVLDDGVPRTHEDFIGQYIGGYDFGDNDPDPNQAAGTHGAGCAGIIAALTDNGRGMAGICWRNVKIVGLKLVSDADSASGFLDGAAIINAMSWCATNQQQFNIRVMSMSFGSFGDPGDTSNPEYVAAKSCYDKGILLVASAGNSSEDAGQHLPSAFPFVQSVSALTVAGTPSSYTNFGKVELAAPGGEFPLDSYAIGVASLGLQPNGYQVFGGTSSAAPHVAGVGALLLSVPGVTRDLAAQTLLDTADRSRQNQVPDRYYGYGVVDAYAALVRVSVTATILDPVGVNASGQTTDPSGIAPPTMTFRPMLRFRVSNAPLNQVKIYIDNSSTPLDSSLYTVESGDPSALNPLYVIAFRYNFPQTPPYQHSVRIEATNPNTGTTVSDIRYFTIQPYQIRPGLSMFSLPFYESAADSPTGSFREANALLGNEVTLYRYNPLATTPANAYVEYTNNSDKLARATANGSAIFRPLSAAFQPFNIPGLQQPLSDLPNEEGREANNPPRPVGLGYFIRANGTTNVNTYGLNFGAKSFRIPLYEGWNLVGNPFPFTISYNATFIDRPNGTRITAQEAVERKLIQPFLYRYVGNEYSFRVLPDGLFVPWEGHWMYVNPRDPRNPSASPVLTLVLPPSPTTTVVASNRLAQRTRAENPAEATPDTNIPRISGPNSWALRLVAQTRDLSDSYNFVGMTGRATDGEDRTKVPKPPRLSPYVSLGIARSTNPGVFYAQDLRPIGSSKQWDVVVATDQSEQEVVLTWPNIRQVPRNYRLMLTDKATGQTVDLRNQGSYRFTSAKGATTRAFVLTARASQVAGRALLTNVYVNPGRSSDGRSGGMFEIGYTTTQDVNVEVSILSGNGRLLSRVAGTRAVEQGENRAYWNGRDNAGRALPAGNYVLQLRAITAEGEITRVTRPLILTGR